MMGVFLLIMDSYGNRVLLNVAKEQVRQSGESIVSVLGKRLTIAETIVNSMANVAESLPANEQLHHQILKPIVDYDESENYIAGGGVWPEPYLYLKQIERRSFFWGRNQEKTLEYFDDYNLPDGNGYHNEEWYVPSALLKKGQVYWSRSYMDPYSHQAMVTVTAAMFRNNKHYGAATIDLSLDGLSQLLAAESAKFGGYAYALDRNGTFISYPDESISKKVTVQENGETTTQFTNIKDVSKNNNNIPDVTKALLQTENISRLNENMNIKAQALAAKSYQIDLFEAHRIISTLEDPLKYKNYGDTFIKEFIIKLDPILHKPVIMNVFHIPKTYWKVIMVTPMDQVTATSDGITDAVITGFIYVIAIGLFIGLIAIHLILIHPLNKIYHQISGKNKKGQLITGINKGELGALAQRFNDNTSDLIAANSELKQSVIKAEQATIAKTQFLANMSHEIRTPMNGVNGMLSLLQKSQLTQQQKHYANVAKSSADNLLVLINDILDFSKIESGKLDLENIDFNIRESLNDFFTSMVHLAENKNVELVLDLSGLELEWIKGDPGRIRQILSNLISNAIKFTENGYVLVKIGVKDVNEMGLILYGSVLDTGIGIQSDKLDLLFESFSQVDASTTREYGGTGLGLSISKQLCELMQGSISVKSKLGEGSKFEFTLTLDKSVKDKNKDLDRYVEYKSVLIYDENSHSEKILYGLLEKRGAKVVTVNKIDQLLEALNTPLYDILFMDIRRLDFDSKVESDLKEIKNACVRSNTKLIGLVLATSAKTEGDYAAMGCDQIVPKPIIDSTIDAVIRSLYSKVKESNPEVIEELEGVVKWLNNPGQLNGVKYPQ